jgi:hypothetical protein
LRHAPARQINTDAIDNSPGRQLRPRGQHQDPDRGAEASGQQDRREQRNRGAALDDRRGRRARAKHYYDQTLALSLMEAARRGDWTPRRFMTDWRPTEADREVEGLPPPGDAERAATKRGLGPARAGRAAGLWQADALRGRGRLDGARRPVFRDRAARYFPEALGRFEDEMRKSPAAARDHLDRARQ